MQDPSWADVKDHWQWRGILVRDGAGKIAAVLSLLCRKLPLGCCLAYGPRGPVCDREDEAALGALTAGLKDFARQNRCLLTYLDPDEPEENAAFCARMQAQGFRRRHSEGFGGIQPHSVFRLSLENMDEEKLLASFAPKTRYNIRLSQRRGVTIARYPGSEPVPGAVLERFHALMCATGKRDGFFVRDRTYFETLLRALGDRAVLYMADWEGEPIAGTIGIFCGGKAWYLYGASGNAHREAMPNYLLQWTMMGEAMKRQCGLYDLRGVPGTGAPEDPLYGLYRFKKGFGGAHIRFTGLFTFYHRPVLGRLLDWAQNAFRALRRQKSYPRPTPPP